MIKGKEFDKKETFKCCTIISIFLIINIVFRNIIGRDYYDYLTDWIKKIIELGGINSLSVQIGNYTPPYMYFLVLGTYITSNYVFWIKFISNLFTIGIVIITYFIIKEVRKDAKLSSSLLVLLIPGVFVNSSIVGQCDAIYTFFVLLFVYLILKNKKRSALFFFGVAIAFKIQSIFIAPIFLYLLLKKKIKIIDIIYVVIGFFISMIPSFIYGRSVIDILEIILGQTGGNVFVQGAPNIYSQFKLNYVKTNRLIILLLSFLTILFSAFIVLRNTKNKEYNNNTFLEKVLLLSIMIPYFLPSMHDRYFYMANILFYIYFLFVDNIGKRRSNIINFILISLSCALPVILYNFVCLKGVKESFLCEWIGISMISSTIMTYLILVCLDRFLLKSSVTK